MSFKLKWADKKAQKAFERLSPLMKPKIQSAIQSFQSNPKPNAAKMLSGKLKGTWRLRINDYRVLYDLDETHNVIYLLDVGHRRSIYR